MKRITKIFSILPLLFILASVLQSNSLAAQQDIYVEINCTNQYPGVGEKIKLSYILKMKLKGGSASVSHSGIKIAKPAMKSMNILEEGSEGNSFSFGGFGGGDMQLSKYSFILQPTKKGKITIDPLSFTMNGKTYKSKSYTFNVGTGDPKLKVVPQNANLFIRIEVSKKNLYLGEHTLITYKLYSHYSNISIQDYEFPMTNGLWSEEIKPKGNGWQQTQENIGGKGYLVVTLKKEIVFAQKTGDVKIPSFSIDLLVGGGFFSQGSKETVTSNSPVIKVKPLPSGAPDNFGNQVGRNYKMDMSYSTNQLKSGEALDIKIKISGRGNLKQIEAPELNFPTDFEVYDPEIKESIKLSTSGLSGYKEFNYLVIPRHHGDFEIPKFSYSYFDLHSKSYKTLSFPAQSIHVEKGEGGAMISTNDYTTQKEDVKVLDNEIRHIESKTNLKKADSNLFNSSTFWIGITTPPLIFIGALLFMSFKPKEKDWQLHAKKTASKKAFKTLAAAESCLQTNDDKGFYESLHKGLLSYLSNKFSVPTSQLSKENIRTTLLTQKIPENISNDFIKIVEECEMARYAPITHAGAQDTMKKAKLTIQNIEKNA